MKILFILPWVPYPLDSGGNQAFFNMLNTIRKEHSVSLVTYSHSSMEKKMAQELQSVWPDVDIECYSDHKSSIPANIRLSKGDQRKCEFYSYIERSMQRKKARILRRYEMTQDADYSNNQPNTSTEFTIGGFVKENSTLYRNTTDLNPNFLDFIYKKSREGFDMVQVEFYEYLPLVYVLPENVRKVFVHHEIRFVRNENEISLFDHTTMMDNIKFNKQKDEELALLARYNDIIVLTEVDKTLLKQYLPSQNIYVSPALTNASSLIGKQGFTPANDLAFLGGGGHFPNADGMLWFAMEVFPLLKNMHFKGDIYVAGKWGDAIQKIIHNYCPEIRFVGFVDDLYDFLNGKITIIPIRIGSGMRMKIMDAMAASSPMITTAKGCEGLPFANGTDCFIANDAKTFAESIIKIQSDKEQQRTMVENSSMKMKTLLDETKLLNTRLGFYRQN